jgi:hypothetical protein
MEMIRRIADTPAAADLSSAIAELLSPPPAIPLSA